ncbi:trypsin-like peptidase domain-containing protein [Ancylothrix sp. C2]|uniref:trypsin-like peptidase domain-containing protein n=1 Tax=Ancylothrix sp. D3o TaxID=2953691 RepID=UPI0021BB8D0E|nr:trypsin-like peptidase domain-containing protein [Ancylothrix sp. D3o]MCT7948631.1 trypsin-like peptidase domain-containing protein [Ancylothrix sp. D3o]
MKAKILHRAITGMMATALATTTLSLETFGPNNLFPHNRAVAQDVDEQTNIRVYEKASPAVVSINVGSATGSGSIISSDGLVLTNAHVISQGGRRNVTVTLSDGRRLPAEVLAFGERGLDLAILKIQGQNNLPTVPLAPVGSVKVGQRAYAIGNPFGRFQGTFTVGIVSRIDTSRGLIQTDAAINPGNSGGPLLNSQGQLIGVNTAIFTGARQGGNIGIGFAINVDRVQPFLTAVREGRAPRNASTPRTPSSNQPPKPISLNGQTIAGRLGPGSNVLRADNSFFDIYTFQGRAGERVVIEMASQEIDPFLILLSPSGRDLAQDDDGGSGQNARIVAVLPSTGTYTVIANSAERGQEGGYSLRASSNSGNRATTQQTVSGNSIARLEGILGPGASVLPSDGSLYRESAFQGSAGQSVTITLRSPDFDTYLVVIDPEGKIIAQNNDISPNDKNSSLQVKFQRTGTYRVIINAHDRGGRGRYLLTIE